MTKKKNLGNLSDGGWTLYIMASRVCPLLILQSWSHSGPLPLYVLMSRSNSLWPSPLWPTGAHFHHHLLNRESSYPFGSRAEVLKKAALHIHSIICVSKYIFIVTSNLNHSVNHIAFNYMVSWTKGLCLGPFHTSIQ